MERSLEMSKGIEAWREVYLEIHKMMSLMIADAVEHNKYSEKHIIARNFLNDL